MKTAGEFRRLLEQVPDNTLVLVETRYGCLAGTGKPGDPGDGVQPFSRHEAEHVRTPSLGRKET